MVVSLIATLSSPASHRDLADLGRASDIVIDGPLATRWEDALNGGHVTPPDHEWPDLGARGRSSFPGPRPGDVQERAGDHDRDECRDRRRLLDECREREG